MNKFTPTPEMIEAAKNVFMMMAYVDTIKPIVRGYQTRILQAHQFHIAKEWTDKGHPDEIILEPDHTYLMEDSDFQVYLQETFQERDKAGLKIDNPDFCPLLVAESLLSTAENTLIDSMEPVTHLEAYRIYGDNRKKFIDLTLRLLAPFVGSAKEILANVA
jgi:hypothetical protein